MILLGSALMTGSFGTVNAIALDVAQRNVSATTVAVGYVITNLLGLGAGPLITGTLSDAYGLTTALIMVPAFGVVAAIALIAVLPLYDRDLAKVGAPGAGERAIA
jgi:fucose permease